VTNSPRYNIFPCNRFFFKKVVKYLIFSSQIVIAYIPGNTVIAVHRNHEKVRIARIKVWQHPPPPWAVVIGFKAVPVQG
jgi:ribosomal protein S12